MDQIYIFQSEIHRLIKNALQRRNQDKLVPYDEDNSFYPLNMVTIATLKKMNESFELKLKLSKLENRDYSFAASNKMSSYGAEADNLFSVEDR